MTKATIRSTEARVEMNVQFNPKELQVDKTVSWTPKSSHTENPVQEFKEPQSSTLSCTLYFDTYEDGVDVYDKYIKDLEKLVTMVELLGRPPMVVFGWKNFTFQGVVESLSQKYTMFTETGLRARCEVGFKMKSAVGATVSARRE